MLPAQDKTCVEVLSRRSTERAVLYCLESSLRSVLESPLRGDKAASVSELREGDNVEEPQKMQKVDVFTLVLTITVTSPNVAITRKKTKPTVVPAKTERCCATTGVMRRLYMEG